MGIRINAIFKTFAVQGSHLNVAPDMPQPGIYFINQIPNHKTQSLVEDSIHCCPL